MPKFHENIIVFGSGRFPGEFFEESCVLQFLFFVSVFFSISLWLSPWSGGRVMPCASHIDECSLSTRLWPIYLNTFDASYITCGPRRCSMAAPHTLFFFFLLFRLSLFEKFKFMRQLSHRIKNRQIQMCIVFYLFGRKWKKWKKKKEILRWMMASLGGEWWSSAHAHRKHYSLDRFSSNLIWNWHFEYSRVRV